MNRDLFLAILAMDSYNRGYRAGISENSGDSILNSRHFPHSLGIAATRAYLLDNSSVATQRQKRHHVRQRAKPLPRGEGAGIVRLRWREGEWCCWGGLNSRPQPYQGCALPLSYSSTPFRMVRCGLGRLDRGALLAVRPCFVKPNPDSAERLLMREDQPPQSRELTREERLAAKLRENLRRRKAQARGKALEADADGNADAG